LIRVSITANVAFLIQVSLMLLQNAGDACTTGTQWRSGATRSGWCKHRRRSYCGILLLLALSSCTAKREPAPGWTDITGRNHRVLEVAGRPATVLLFVATDCPIANAYAHEFSRIVDVYKDRGVAFYAVHADADVSLDVAARHAKDYGYRCPVLLDPKQELARTVGATVTPEAAVLDARGRVVYLGRIDDLFYGFGRRREVATKHELRDAIDAVLARRPVVAASEPPFGCEIPPLKESQ
jgi:hypothetical protein